LIRCTVPVPTPSVVAILRMPVLPFFNALRIAPRSLRWSLAVPGVFGFAAALRRSKPRSARRGDIERHATGLLLRIGSSKTDQEGAAAHFPIPHGCRLTPVEALEAWLAAAKITDGPVFVSVGKGNRVCGKRLSGNAIGGIVKRYAAAAGFDARDFAGHSLRAGFVTSALEDGADLLKVMDVTRHRCVETLKGCDRRAKSLPEPCRRCFYVTYQYDRGGCDRSASAKC
jgi:integrase